MPVISRDQFRVSVVLYPEDGFWIAQGVQFDITARGSTPIEASERFNDKFGAELVMSIELGEPPLAGVGAAPPEFWEMYENAKMHAAMDDTPIRLSDGATPYVHQDIKITDRLRAA
jgi:hypothetical protein